MQEKAPLWRRLLRAVPLTLLTIVLLAAFFIAVIMGNPQDAEGARAVTQEQPLLPAMTSPILIQDEGQLNLLLANFPGQVMAAMHSAALTFGQGLCEDVPFEDGMARRITLSYITDKGALVTVESIYPARAIQLVEKGDYVISGTAGLPLAGLRSLRMETRDAVRMHAQGSTALYVVTLPGLTNTQLRTLTSTLQLYQGE